MTITLKDLKPGQRALVTNVGGSGALRQHFLDMGIIPSATVELIKFAPMGDPIEFRIHGYELTLRLADAAQIAVDTLPEKPERPAEEDRDHLLHIESLHPGLGEEGKYHDKSQEQAIADGTCLTFALAGNQNCGKTTLFNTLTGSNQHVGTFPGVPVEQRPSGHTGR